MKLIIRIVLCFIMSVNTVDHVISQDCLGGWTTYTSQSEIDSFPIKYPGCTIIEGNLNITGDDITNLDGLSSLIAINNFLRIRWCPNLKSLNGLQNITHIGGRLTLIETKITSLEEFGNLNSVQGIWLEENSELINFTGLENLQGDLDILFIINNQAINDISNLGSSINITGEIRIVDNNSLVSLRGLESLIHAKSEVKITDNGSLTNLIGLDNLTSINGGLRIYNNGNLKNLSGLENLSVVTDRLMIGNNQELVNITALSAIDTVGTLTISLNNRLRNLNGLGGIKDIGNSLFIRNNDSLSQLTEFLYLETLKGTLTISDNPQLESLEGLEHITAVTSTLRIDGNTNVNDLSGLENIESVGGLEISNCPKISSLSKLEKLSFIDQQINISENSSLIDISILEKINSLEWYLRISENKMLQDLNALRNIKLIGHSIDINGNDSLTTLEGLQNLNTVEAIYIRNNASLIGIRDLPDLKSLGLETFRLEGNSNLSACSNDNVCNYLLSGGNAVIENNVASCNSIDEVIENCTVHVDDISDKFEIFPNPISDFISINPKKQQETNLTIHAMNGHVVFESNIFTKTRLNVSSLTSGTYFLKFRTGDSTLVKKIIKL